MKELDSARDSLLSLCTPGGQDALTLEVSHLHQLCTSSQEEVRERLTACEAQLEKLDRQLAKEVQGLKERAAALQLELCSLDQALSYSEPQNNIIQLQQHWLSLQVINAFLPPTSWIQFFMQLSLMLQERHLLTFLPSSQKLKPILMKTFIISPDLVE